MLKPEKKMPVAGAAGSVGGAHPHRAELWSFPDAKRQQHR